MYVCEMSALPDGAEAEKRVSVIYTIGSNRFTAEHFFERLRQSGVQIVLDVRLKTNSQLAGFAKTPDIGYFVKQIIGARYVHDELLAPSKELLEAYRKKEIDWPEYEVRFDALMNQRKIDMHILRRYADVNQQKYCILCSEDTAEHCHRRLVAQRIGEWFGLRVVHL